MPEATVGNAFTQQRTRPFGLKLDACFLLQKFIALFCANLGFQSVTTTSLNILLDVVYKRIEYLCEMLKFIFEECLDPSSVEINLTVVAKIFFQLLDIHPRDLIASSRDSVRYCTKLVAANRQLTRQYEQLLIPIDAMTFTYEAALESDEFFIVGQYEGDDLGLDLLNLKELGLQSNIPKSLLRYEELGSDGAST